MTGSKLQELLRGVSHVTFKLEGIGEETHKSKDVYDAIQEWVSHEVTKATAVYEQLQKKNTPVKVKEIHIDEYYCPTCGAENGCSDGKVEDNFCPNCGQRFAKSSEEIF